MADFFTRMAERALGVATVAAPDLPAMFAPGAPLEASSEIVAPREKFPARAPAQLSLVAADRSEKTPTGPPTQSAMEIARRNSEARSPAADAQLESASESIPRVYAALEGPEPASAHKHGFDPRSLARPLNKIAPQSSGSPIIPASGEFAAPAIHVSIGRVEVRAVAAPTPPPRPRERKSAPLRPLDQYLRDRNEGRR